MEALLRFSWNGYRPMGSSFKDYRVIILAAGLSSRMKSFKPLLPLGDKTIIEQTISRFIEAGIDSKDVLAVVGKRAEEVKRVLDNIGISSVVNEDYESTDMFYSMRLALQCIDSGPKGVMISPGDIPLISPRTIGEIIKKGEEGFGNIIIPTFNKRRGHPIFIGRALIPSLINYQGKEGLRSFLKEYQEEAHYFEALDPLMLVDVDKPEDYEKITELYREERATIGGR